MARKMEMAAGGATMKGRFANNPARMQPIAEVRPYPEHRMRRSSMPGLLLS
jgi:hypothetical protein